MYKMVWLTMIILAVLTCMIQPTISTVTEGNDCRVIFKDIEYDLWPLKRIHNFDVGDYTWKVAICQEASGCSINNNGKAGSCHLDKGKNNSFYVLGEWNDKPIYDSDKNQLKLVYDNGTPYRDVNKTPRKSEIHFICDETTDHGNVTFIEEKNKTYFFELKTRYACPKVPRCYYRNSTHFIDFRPLAGKYSYGNGDVEFCSGSNTIHNQNVSYGRFKKSFSLKLGSSLKFVYEDGDVCDENGGRFSSYIEFDCDRTADENTKPVLTQSGACIRVFKWNTTLVCNWTHMEFNKCILKTDENESIDVRQIKLDKLLLADNSTVHFNLCGDGFNLGASTKAVANLNTTLQGCEDSAICREFTSNGTKHFINLGILSTRKTVTNYRETAIVYNGTEKCDNGENVTTELIFVCDRSATADTPVELVGSDERSRIIGGEKSCIKQFEVRRSTFCLHYEPKRDHIRIDPTIKPNNRENSTSVPISSATGATTDIVNKTMATSQPVVATTESNKQISTHESDSNEELNLDYHMPVNSDGNEVSNQVSNGSSKFNLLKIFWFLLVVGIGFIFVYFLIFTVRRDSRLRSLFKAPILPTFRYSSSPEHSDTAKLVSLECRSDER